MNCFMARLSVGVTGAPQAFNVGWLVWRNYRQQERTL